MMRTDSSTWSEALVWVLAHSLWQGAAIAGAVWLALRWLPARRPERRYGVATLGLSVLVLSTLVTWSLLRLDRVAQATLEIAIEPEPSFFHASQEGRAGLLETEPLPIQSPPVESDGDTGSASGTPPERVWTTWLAALWSVGAGVMLARSLLGIAQAQTLSSGQGSLADDELSVLRPIAAELSHRLGLRRIAPLAISARIQSPMVIGTVWPCVLIPAAMLSGVPVEQWRIILAHELAHIRRHDALINLAQMLIESLLFFNPAVWWLSRQIRIEREACCDALAASVSGEPLVVARALVEVAAALQGDARWPSASSDPATGQALAGATSMAFAKSDEGELTERVQRLIDPDRAPRAKVSFTGLIGATLALLLGGAVLQQGTDVVVRAAAELMSPKERVDRIARLQAEKLGVYLPPAGGPEDNADFPNEAGVATRNVVKEKVKVTIVVRTADGSDVPGGIRVGHVSLTGHLGIAISGDGPAIELPEYRKTYQFDPCRLQFAVYAKGLAYSQSPVIPLFEGDPPRTVEVILKRGARAVIKIVDQQSRPIHGAQIKCAAQMSINGSPLGVPILTYKSDNQGMIAIDDIGDGEYGQEIRAAGFLREKRDGGLSTTAINEWMLTPARPTPFRVVDGSTGAPVEGARFQMIHFKDSHGDGGLGDPRQQLIDSWNVYAVSDALGAAVLSELEDTGIYQFGILKTGYAMTVLNNVTAGQPERTVKLHSPLTLAGRVVGALDRLPMLSMNNGPSRGIQLTTKPRTNDVRNIPVDENGRFEIADLFPGEKVTLQYADGSQDFEMTESRRGVELKIVAPVAPDATPIRQVIIRLSGATANAPVRGSLDLRWRLSKPGLQSTTHANAVILNNEVRASVPVGTLLSYQTHELAGYFLEGEDQIPIVAGDRPLVIEAPVHPAGAVHGTVVRADGSSATDAVLTVFASKLPPGVTDHRSLNPRNQLAWEWSFSTSDNSSPSISSFASKDSFVLNLPLGGRYRLLAQELNDRRNVWSLSDEFSLDENQPIQEQGLALPAGRSFPVKALDPEGKPVLNQPVQLQLEFSQRNGHATSVNLIRRTGADGIALFENLSLDAPIAPLDLTMIAEATPVRFRGLRRTIDPREPVTLHLERGLSATGVVLDAESGKPVPKAEIHLTPADLDRTHYRATIHATTNDQGEFRFEGLEDVEYVGDVVGAASKGAVLTSEGGDTRFGFPHGILRHTLQAGSKHPVRWEVMIPPGSHLRPAD